MLQSIRPGQPTHKTSSTSPPVRRDEVAPAPEDSVFIQFKRTVEDKKVVGRQAELKNGVTLTEDPQARTVTVSRVQEGVPTCLAVLEETTLTLPDEGRNGQVVLRAEGMEQSIGHTGHLSLTRTSGFSAIPQARYFITPQGQVGGFHYDVRQVPYRRPDIRTPFIHTAVQPRPVFAHEAPNGDVVVRGLRQLPSEWQHVAPLVRREDILS